MRTLIATRLSAFLFLVSLACGEVDPVALDGSVVQTDARPHADATVVVDAGVDAGLHDDASVDAGQPPAPTIVSFRSSATRVRAGESVLLTYEVTGATNVTLIRDVGGMVTVLYDGAPRSESVDSGALSETTNFRLQAVSSGGDVEMQLLVTVDMVPTLAIRSFTATPNPAERASTVQVRWEVEGATRVRVREGALTLVDTSTSVSGGQFALPVIEGPRKLQLEATNDVDRRTAELEIRTRDPARVMSFLARPAVFTEASAPVRLRWDVRGETVALDANGDLVPVDAHALTSSVVRDVAEPTVFRLKVAGLGRQTVARRVVVPNADAEQEPNDQPELGQLLPGGVLGELSEAADVDYYRVVVPAGGHVFAELSEVGDRCTRGLGLRFLDAEGRELAEQDSGDRDPCARLDPFEDPGMRGLSAGEYYLVVDGARARTPYGLALLVRGPACGNGLLELASGEQCDDGGTAASDGCSAVCAFELSGTITLPGPEAVLTNGLAVGEIDYYQLVITEPVAVAIETGAPGIGQCDAADTVLTVLDATQQVVARNDDALGLCAAFRGSSELTLAAGSYTIGVRSFDGGRALSTYALRVGSAEVRCGDGWVAPTEVCDDGNLVDGDGCSALCEVELLGGPGGRLDLDFPARAVRVVDVLIDQPGQSITATTSDGLGGCAVDTRLVVAHDGVFLGYEPGGSGCAHIGPRTHGFVANLEPGIYRLYVVNEGSVGGPVVLDVGIINPVCGNGIRETRAQEMCDDGNLDDSDGCTSSCQRVVGGTAVGPGGPPVTFGGTINGPGDQQLIGIELTAPANVFVEIGIPVIGQCAAGDPFAEIYDSSMNLVAFNDDNFGLCSYINPIVDSAARLPAGRYLLAIRSYDRTSPISVFEIRIELRGVFCGNQMPEPGEGCDDGNVQSGDGCSSECQPE